MTAKIHQIPLREMARHYTELLAPEVAGLLYYVPDWSHHVFFKNLWKTGARLNEVFALRRRDYHLNETIPHVVLRTVVRARGKVRPCGPVIRPGLR